MLWFRVRGRKEKKKKPVYLRDAASRLGCPPFESSHRGRELDEPQADGPGVVAVATHAAPFQVGARPQNGREKSSDAARRVNVDDAAVLLLRLPVLVLSEVHGRVSRLGHLLGQRE